MSTLGTQTVCTPRIGGSKYRWPWSMYLLGRLHNLGAWPTISFQVAIKHTNTLRVFAYTSNTLIANFEYMESILASGTLKNFRFLMRSCLSTDRAPVIKLICSTFQPWRCITVLMTVRREAYWFSAVLLALMRYRSQTSDILLCSKIQKVPAVLPTGGRTAIPSGRIRQKLSFTTVSFGIPS